MIIPTKHNAMIYTSDKCMESNIYIIVTKLWAQKVQVDKLNKQFTTVVTSTQMKDCISALKRCKHVCPSRKRFGCLYEGGSQVEGEKGFHVNSG